MLSTAETAKEDRNATGTSRLNRTASVSAQGYQQAQFYRYTVPILGCTCNSGISVDTDAMHACSSSEQWRSSAALGGEGGSTNLEQEIMYVSTL